MTYIRRLLFIRIIMSAALALALAAVQRAGSRIAEVVALGVGARLQPLSAAIEWAEGSKGES